MALGNPLRRRQQAIWHSIQGRSVSLGALQSDYLCQQAAKSSPSILLRRQARKLRPAGADHTAQAQAQQVKAAKSFPQASPQQRLQIMCWK
jgi:hypothetical protein